MTPNDAINKMRGPKSSKVKILILRDGESEPLELNLTRDIIKASPVKFHLYDDYAYIRVASFSMQTVDSAKQALEELRKKAGNKKIKGYVLDLRNNPGGILEQSVYLANLFIDKGKIVSTRGRDQKEQSSFNATSEAIVKDTPLVVLINNGSASASEIVAGALQDNKRAIIIGTKSFGKGSVQSVMNLPGYGALKLTTAFYYTPSGRSIQAEGIVPDIIVEPAKVELLSSKNKKLQLSESKLKNHLRNLSEVAPSKYQPKTTEEFWKELYDQDYQLARALDVLKTMVTLQKR
jgi:carboxyl-terminal processing protease